jgi:hypothetical protein
MSSFQTRVIEMLPLMQSYGCLVESCLWEYLLCSYMATCILVILVIYYVVIWPHVFY